MGTGERPLAEPAAEITGAAVRLAAATAAWLRLIAEFDRREGWAGAGITSCAHWLSWQCGLSPGAAREHVRVARALHRLPLITAAFAAGRISYAKVRALTRVADPSCEADLLELAVHTTASQVERAVRAWRRAEADDTESLAARQRFDYWWDDDGDVLADDAAAGRAHLDEGPPLSRRQVLRMACEATAVVMLESGGEPLALGRRRRYATRAQRRALLHRDGGCARPGCEETRIERLHAHHLRHWLFGGRTDLTNLVLLCDRDHGLAHDLDLVMTRRDGELIAATPNGRRVWAPADSAFPGGVTGLEELGGRSVSTPLFPEGEPRLAEAMAVGGERMDLRYVVGVLMTNRELTRRLAEQNGRDVAA